MKKLIYSSIIASSLAINSPCAHEKDVKFVESELTEEQEKVADKIYQLLVIYINASSEELEKYKQIPPFEPVI